MNIKKLIASVVVALGAWLGVGVVQADTLTYYDFSYTATTYAPGSVIGVFGVDGAKVIQSLTGIVSGTGTAYDGAIGGLLPIGYFGGNDNLYSPTSPFLTGSGVSFYTGSNPASNPNTYNLYYGAPSLENGDGYLSFGTMTSSLCISNCTGGGVAPEMNASLIPQVGLLLGCLFFLFGRKKETVVPMLTA